MKRATLHIIHGFLGAGKTTFSQKLATELLATELNAVHLNPDEWCMKLFAKEEFENNWEKCFTATLEILWQKTREYLNKGTDVIFDSGFWDRASRDYARQVAEECHSDFKHYFIDTPDNVAKQRLSLRSGKIATNNIKNFDEIKKLFSAPDADEEVIIIK